MWAIEDSPGPKAAYRGGGGIILPSAILLLLICDIHEVHWFLSDFVKLSVDIVCVCVTSLVAQPGSNCYLNETVFHYTTTHVAGHHQDTALRDNSSYCYAGR